MSRDVWYLHGAHATSRSFAWLKRELPAHSAVDIEYSTDIPMKSVLADLVKRAENSEPFDIVGHSLGGVLAVALSQKTQNVRNIVTLSAPFGGSAIAAMLRWVSPGTVLDDIHPHSQLILGLRAKPIGASVTSVVTTGGRSPLLPDANDGVVSVSSQRSLLGPSYIERSVNHFEVLLDLDTSRIISEHLWK